MKMSNFISQMSRRRNAGLMTV